MDLSAFIFIIDLATVVVKIPEFVVFLAVAVFKMTKDWMLMPIEVKKTTMTVIAILGLIRIIVTKLVSKCLK
jgi:hypothetical protein